MKLAEIVARQIGRQNLLKPGDRVGAAVSGGADSVALLRLLIELRKELGIVLSVIHFHHKLRGSDADEDEKFVGELAREHSLAFHSGRGNVRDFAAEKHLSIEAAARRLRYEYFAKLMNDGDVNRVATGHTLDDQAETVLLRIVRGAGTRGLAGIHPVVKVAEDRWIVRPLLKVSQPELEAYLQNLGQGWREDASNRDLGYARNRVRHEILPQMEQRLNPSARQALVALAEIALSEEDYWNAATKKAMAEVRDPAAPALKLQLLRRLPLALQRRVIRAVAGEAGLKLEFRHVEEVLQLCGTDVRNGEKAELPHGWSVCREKNSVCFLQSAGPRPSDCDYCYSLAVPGEVCVPEARVRLQTELVSATEQSYNSQHLFEPTMVAAELHVRNWRAGDRFWPAHTKAPKKIKELMQERHVPAVQRRVWPVIVSGEDIIWVRGFAMPAHLRPKGGRAVLIRESDWKAESISG